LEVRIPIQEFVSLSRKVFGSALVAASVLLLATGCSRSTRESWSALYSFGQPTIGQPEPTGAPEDTVPKLPIDDLKEDMDPPSVPSELRAQATSSSGVVLTWQASFDGTKVVGYRVVRNGIDIARTAEPRFEDSGLSPWTNYSYMVSAYDAAGNISGNSTPVSVRTHADAISRSHWVLKYVDSEETVGENARGLNAFDGNPSTFWRTHWSSNIEPPPPHEIQIDLGGWYLMSGFRYLPKPDPIDLNGRIARYEFYVSAGGDFWGEPVAIGTFTNDISEKEVSFPPKVGRFVRLRALSEVNGNPWTAVAELNVLGVPGPSQPIEAPHFYVSPSGSNSNDGSMSSPWATLSYACGRVQTEGAIIVVGAGSYTDNGQCILAPKVNIEGDGKNLVTIKSSYSSWYLRAESNPIIDGNQKVSGFKLDGNGRSLARGMQVVGRHRFTIENVDFTAIRDTAIHMVGMLQWHGIQNGCSDWLEPVPPPDYARGDVIRNVTITGCSPDYLSENTMGASVYIQSLEDLLIERMVVEEGPSFGSSGNAIKSWPGWLKHMTIRDSKFRISLGKNPFPFVLEFWNLETDSEVYNSEFYGMLSLVSARQNGGTWALKFHDNYVNFAEAVGYYIDGHEISMSHLDFYNNHVVGHALGLWNASNMYNKYGVNHIRIRNNVFDRSDRKAIALYPGIPMQTGMDDIQIVNNVITDVGNPKGGIVVAVKPAVKVTNLKIMNNVIQRISGMPALYLEGASAYNILNPIVTNNDFFGTGSIVNTGATAPVISNNLNVDPKFRKSGEWREFYSLEAGSPLINAGANVGLPFNGSAPEIGAFESSP